MALSLSGEDAKGLRRGAKGYGETPGTPELSAQPLARDQLADLRRGRLDAGPDLG
jgi:hypothetical protein